MTSATTQRARLTRPAKSSRPAVGGANVKVAHRAHRESRFPAGALSLAQAVDSRRSRTQLTAATRRRPAARSWSNAQVAERSSRRRCAGAVPSQCFLVGVVLQV